MTALAPPNGAWDCHVHIFGPADQFTLAEPRAYDPGLADVTRAQAMLDGLGLDHVVLVQPSVYGSDNACLLDALARFAGRARGVAVVDPARTTGAELDVLKRAGVCALRLNWVVGDYRLSAADMRARLRDLLPVACQHHWHVLVHAPTSLIAELAPTIAESAVPTVLDHLAGVRTAPEHCDADAAIALDLLKAGHVWVKIAAPYRLAAGRDDMMRLAAFVRRLADLCPDRLIWGSDWPHTSAHSPGRRSQGFRRIDTSAVLSDLSRLVGDPNLVRRILRRNPLALYGS